MDHQPVYKGEEVEHEFAVVVAVAMDYDAISQSPTIVSRASSVATWIVIDTASAGTPGSWRKK